MQMPWSKQQIQKKTIEAMISKFKDKSISVDFKTG